jgi:hypothetical protein
MLSAKRLKGSSGALDGGGEPPDTERAISEAEPSRDSSAFRLWAPILIRSSWAAGSLKVFALVGVYACGWMRSARCGLTASASADVLDPGCYTCQVTFKFFCLGRNG